MDSAVRNQRAPGDWGQGRGGLGKRHLVNIKQTKARQTSGQLDLTFTYCLLSSAFLLLLFDSTLLCAPFLYFFYFFFLSPNVAVKVNGIMSSFWSAAASMLLTKQGVGLGSDGWLVGSREWAEWREGEGRFWGRSDALRICSGLGQVLWKWG